MLTLGPRGFWQSLLQSRCKKGLGFCLGLGGFITAPTRGESKGNTWTIIIGRNSGPFKGYIRGGSRTGT